MKLNLAARAGRWSAAHWKTATFGWLAFVVVAVVLGGAVGTKQLDNDVGRPASPAGWPGSSTRASRPAPRRPSSSRARSSTADAPAFQAALEDVGRRVSALPAVTNVPPSGRQISADRRSAIVAFDIRGDPDDAGDKIDPVLAAVDDAQAANPGSRSAPSERRRPTRTERGGRQGPRAGRPALDPGHDRGPDRRLRRARRRGHPAAARPVGGRGDDGPARAAEPDLAGGREHRRGRPADRPRRGRRLRALLPQARTGGTSRGAQRKRGTAGRGGHVRSRRAGLRPDRDGRDGRDVPDRRQDVLLLRAGDDPGRRDRGAGLADRPAGAPVPARRPRQQGAHPLPVPPPAAGGWPVLELDARPRPAPARRLGRPLGGHPRGAGAARARDEDRRAGRRGAAEGHRGGAGLRPAPGRLPGRGRARGRGRQGGLGRRAPREGGDRRPPQARRSRAAGRTSP